MRSRRRLIAACALAALCAPGNILRTPVPDTFPKDIALQQVAGPSDTATSGWRVEGVWHFSADSINFGGYSGLLALAENRLRAFSDRGTRFTFREPDQRPEDARSDAPLRRVDHQLTDPNYANKLWDIEAATRDPVTGAYWLSFESFHAVHRYTVSGKQDGVRELGDEVDWSYNSGAEGMVRLADGRFLLVQEGKEKGVIFDQDPVEGGEPVPITWINPAPGFAVTDLAQLPDGRVLALMRDVDWSALEEGWPPFASRIAIGDPPGKSADEPWELKLALDLTGIVPRENYEGLAVRPQDDGTLAIWLIADDNLSAFQRTLVVKLGFDPDA